MPDSLIDPSMPSNPPPPTRRPSSPLWTSTTKLVVGLTLVAIAAGLFVSFRNLVGPLILAFVLAYLLYPPAKFLRERLSVSWRLSVNMIYLLVLIVVLSLLTWSGIVVVEQVTNLINFLEKQIDNLPQIIADLSANPLHIGPFVVGPSNLDITELWNQLSGVIDPVFSRVGGLFGTFASSAVVTFGWIFFIVLISYFILSESTGNPGQFFHIQIPGYEEDISRIGVELGRIWNAFLRNQFLIFLITIILYTVLFGALNVRYFYGLALLAGFARFVPYVGPAVAWTAYGLVSYFQGYTLFGLTPLGYAIMVVAVAWVTDIIMDNFLSPRLMGEALRVHPAAVMVAALVGASLLGVIGIVLAAPVLATAKLFVEYILRKLTDQEPWPVTDASQPPPSFRAQLALLMTRFSQISKRLFRRERPEQGNDPIPISKKE